MGNMAAGGIVGMSIRPYALMTLPAVLRALIGCAGSCARKERTLAACKTSLAIFAAGSLLFLSGSRLFTLFGFTPDALSIGPGPLLAAIAARVIFTNMAAFLDSLDSLDWQAPPRGACAGVVMPRRAGAERENDVWKAPSATCWERASSCML